MLAKVISAVRNALRSPARDCITVYQPTSPGEPYGRLGRNRFWGEGWDEWQAPDGRWWWRRYDPGLRAYVVDDMTDEERLRATDSFFG